MSRQTSIFCIVLFSFIVSKSASLFKGCEVLLKAFVGSENICCHYLDKLAGPEKELNLEVMQQ
jgi:hypothetical protein